MCFAIPYKVIKVKSDHIVLENGKRLSLPKEPVQSGEYVRTTGNTIDSILSEEEGENIRKLIKSVYNELI